jgi:hypothetical protein
MPKILAPKVSTPPMAGVLCAPIRFASCLHKSKNRSAGNKAGVRSFSFQWPRPNTMETGRKTR